MRLYLRVKDVIPPDGFQPNTEFTFVDIDGGEVAVNFLSANKLRDIARTLMDQADDLLRSNDQQWRDSMREHVETNRDDYEWPEQVAS